MPLLVGTKLYALFHDIRGKLVLGERQKLRCDDLDNLSAILRLAMLYDMLSNIIAVLISDQV